MQVCKLNNPALCLLSTMGEKNISSNKLSASGAGGTIAENSIALFRVSMVMTKQAPTIIINIIC